MDTKKIVCKMEELSTEDLISIQNQFICEASIGEGDVTPFEELDDLTGISGFTEALKYLGIYAMFPFDYFANDIFYSERFLKTEDEARDYILDTFSNYVDEESIGYFKEALEDYKDDNNKKVIECILSMI